ncbi:TIGR02757 family protein [Flavobacterium cyanobacteriorum]|uniref:TIGR02757 family protein n=1 Tax=Flavobacterium cyanobacteriorum TaxID=2022802 RepID=A0A255ZAA7_9FLAO|nr:TIGR02757 family protein [Flavobacterium cyanobacteriorum]OYQ37550.1 TIGR02757 family protein [Flavobacterium cyanobacteriorum]
MKLSDLKDFLDEKAELYNNPDFISSDPIQIPHAFTLKEDIEISGFLAATIAWGNRKMVVNNCNRMMNFMGNSPYDFVMSHRPGDLEPLQSFVHRTFNGTDFTTFIRGLRHIYINYGGLEEIFSQNQKGNMLHAAITILKQKFFEIEHQQRTLKHIADPIRNSAAKRIHLFLRWMVRQDRAGVDLGIWKQIKPAVLSCPLDVHSGNVARKLGLITRKQDDLKALNELDTHLRSMDASDPVKYDYALFGLGVFEGWKL